MAHKQQQRHPAHAEPLRNSLCRAVGHDWRSTTSDHYRVCQRNQCKAVQRWQQGQWVTVSDAPPDRDPSSVVCSTPRALPQQTALFS